jgi:hypothetical protein
MTPPLDIIKAKDKPIRIVAIVNAVDFTLTPTQSLAQFSVIFVT